MEMYSLITLCHQHSHTGFHVISIKSIHLILLIIIDSDYPMEVNTGVLTLTLKRTLLLWWFHQAAGAERAAPAAERGAKGPAAAQRQAPAAERTDLPPL